MPTDATVTTVTATETVDARIPRFTASVTLAVMVAVLALSAVNTRAAAVLLALQAVVFAIGALGGPRRHPYGMVFTRFLTSETAPTTPGEDVSLLKFSQLIGFIVASIGVLGFASGHPAVGAAATGFAAFAAFMRAAFGICLARRFYTLIQRVRG